MTSDDILDQVKQNVGLEKDSQYDEALLSLISGILAIFNSLGGSSFAEVLPFTQRTMLKGPTGAMRLRFKPIISISYVGDVRDTDLSTTTEDVDGTEPLVAFQDYVLDEEAGVINFLGSASGMIQVEGTFGYLEIPDKIGLAIQLQATFVWQRRKNLGTASTQVAAGQITYNEKMAILDFAREVLEQ